MSHSKSLAPESELFTLCYNNFFYVLSVLSLQINYKTWKVRDSRRHFCVPSTTLDIDTSKYELNCTASLQILRWNTLTCFDNYPDLCCERRVEKKKGTVDCTVLIRNICPSEAGNTSVLADFTRPGPYVAESGFLQVRRDRGSGLSLVRNCNLTERLYKHESGMWEALALFKFTCSQPVAF